MARTAKEISTQELRSYRPWLTMEGHRKDHEVSRRRESAWKVARVAAETLKRRYMGRPVSLFLALLLARPDLPHGRTSTWPFGELRLKIITVRPGQQWILV